MDLSIIIVNYKTPQLLVNCIHSIVKETNRVSFEVIVVDNNSGDNSRKFVLDMFPQIIWIQLDKNIGFAGGNNEGIKMSKGDYVLLLNSDTIILDNAIDKSFSFLKNQKDPSVAILGCKLLKSDNSIQRSSLPNIHWPCIKDTIFQNILIGKIFSSFIRNYNSAKWNNDHLYSSTHFADSIAGAFILFRKNILKKVGLMDADFFMYFEEIEWEHRIAQNGYKIVYYDEASIVHLKGGSSLNLAVKKQLVLSQGLFILKIYGRLGYFFYLLMQYINILSGFVMYPFLSSKSKGIFNSWSKIFLSVNQSHFQIPLKYSKKTSSSKEPLKIL